ncbi:MAG: GTP-binding protein TypA [candidate division TM6 bacterium GW2011_GWF2_28_16]|nr:MAG: GTP-binding protein TypA [candidate division TM6 bacterium GW2011_GWF2_28_16]
MGINTRPDIRNIAIIAHVDHGKTTLVDQMLKQSGTVQVNTETGERVMDSGDIEKERGITITAKNTAILLPEAKINIVDTPGHSDFAGEVERTLQMVEGFLLLVDAAEGPLPGTRFVLQKALALDLKPIVLINKIDRKDADIERIEEAIHELFLELALKDEHLNFKVLYGSSKLGFISEDPTATSGDMQPLFNTILKEIPEPKESITDLQILITNLDHSDYLGRIGIGRVFNGSVKISDQIVACKGDYISKKMAITKLYQFEGLKRVEVDSAKFGDIVAVTGFEEEITIGTTICNADKPNPIAYTEIDEPTLSIFIGVNKSPFSGKEGKLLTSRQIRDRLFKELKTNIALRVEETDSAEVFKVSGRGQLHLGVLIETMRREGFELQASAPEVIYKNIGGKKFEPYELLIIDIEEQYQGFVMENLAKRKSELVNMVHYTEGKIRLEFKIPARGLIGFRNLFMTNTRGTGLMNHRFHDYEPYAGEIIGRTKGALVSMEDGTVRGYALDALQPRGILFIDPGVEVYEGMIVGEHSRENDLDVNPTKQKKLTNMRASGTDEAVKLAPPKLMNIEESLEWIRNDELMEVTPKSIRLRKRFLKAHERKKESRQD